MNPKVWQLMERAREDLQASEDVLQTAFPYRAASDAYYAMFHAAEALLLTSGIEVSSHSATHAAFGLHFAKTRKFPTELHQFLVQAFEARLTTDYDVTVKLALPEVQRLLARAKEFVAAAEEYIRTLEPPPPHKDPPGGTRGE